jgi:hypothetical protein
MQHVRPFILLLLAVAACGGAMKSPARSVMPEPQSELAQGPGVGGEAEIRISAKESQSSPARRSFQAIAGSLTSGTSSLPVQAQVINPAVKQDPEKLVVEAWMELRVDDPAKIANEVRARVEAEGGRVVSENVHGPQNKASSAAMVLRVPPA